MKEKTNHRFYTMSKSIQFCSGFILVLIFSVAAFSQGKSYQSQTAEVNGVKIHYLKAGTGKTPLVLIHGFGETSRIAKSDTALRSSQRPDWGGGFN